MFLLLCYLFLWVLLHSCSRLKFNLSIVCLLVFLFPSSIYFYFYLDCFLLHRAFNRLRKNKLFAFCIKLSCTREIEIKNSLIDLKWAEMLSKWRRFTQELHDNLKRNASENWEIQNNRRCSLIRFYFDYCQSQKTQRNRKWLLFT